MTAKATRMTTRCMVIIFTGSRLSFGSPARPDGVANRVGLDRQNCHYKTPQKELPKKVGVSPYFLKGLMQQARRFDSRQYQIIFNRFLHTDLALKSSGSEPWLHLEKLVLDIAAMERTAK